MDQFQQTFISEAKELLEELEKSLIELEEDLTDMELVAKVFRALHTIKGSGAMFGFNQISEFVHDIENVYDKIRNGEIPLTPEIITITLNARDLIKEMLVYAGEELSDNLLNIKSDISKKIKNFLHKKDNEPQKKQQDKQTQFEKEKKPDETVYRIKFKPHPNLLQTGNDVTPLFKEISQMGAMTIVAHLDNIPEINEINPENCYASWEIILTTRQDINAIKDVFIFVEDDADIDIQQICSDDNCEIKKIGEILVEKGAVEEETIQAILSEKPRIGEVLVEKGKVSQSQVSSAVAEQEHIKEVANKKKIIEESSTIKVDVVKLDKLVNLVGEIVTTQARLAQIALNNTNLEIASVSEEMARLIDDLRDNAMNIRMISIGTLFNKFKRLVRDLSGELNKKINLIIEGAETELDKNVIDRLNDPLVHLIRNSIDHGIESPEERTAKGKNPEGKLVLSARHSGAHVVIEIIDDGKGINPDIIFAKALEKGLVTTREGMSDRDIFNLIFLPGFSTAKKVSNVSGRGVGLDVVRKNLDALRGSVDISSSVDKGTTIFLKIPLTLAIIDGLLTKIANDYFVIPLFLVEGCIELTEDKMHETGGSLVNVRGELVPYINLREIFKINGSIPVIQQAVILRNDEDRFGIVVDSVLGDHQTVIKSLGSIFNNLNFVSGATILGNGEIALILDIEGLSHIP